jgi:hypothetical protein
VPTPEVSIIMPLFNTASYVKAAVEGLLAQTYKDIELLVVDDGSTDGSPGIVASITDRRVRLFQRGRLGGPAVARNLGLAEARGRFITFFDSDDLAGLTMVAELLEFLTMNPAFQIVGGWLQTILEDGSPVGRASGYHGRAEKLASSMLFANCLPTSSLLIERRCIEKEWFDTTLAVASDYDLWARLIVKCKAHVLPRVLGSYRVHPRNITHREQACASGCLERVYRSQLVRLGLQPTTGELALHMQLSKLTFGTPRQAVLAAEQWLLKLDQANALAGLYDRQPFRETLGDRWYGVCHSACGDGLWTWRKFFDSPLSKWSSPTAKQRYQLLRLSAHGALKKLFSTSYQPQSISPS